MENKTQIVEFLKSEIDETMMRINEMRKERSRLEYGEDRFEYLREEIAREEAVLRSHEKTLRFINTY